jgi:hypothetical protein
LNPFTLHIIRFIYLLVINGWSDNNFLENKTIRDFAEQNQCEHAIKAFETLDSAGQIFPETRLRIIDCYFVLKDTSAMKQQLDLLSRIKNKELQSALLNQNALLKAFEGDTLEAINLYKKAIEAKNDNNFAKHNFEYLSKVYHPYRNPNGKAPESRNQHNENSGGQVAQDDRKDDLLNSTENQNINLSQAMQILDAMRNNDLNKILIIPSLKQDTTFYGNQ